MIKDKSYVTIQGWMVNQLKLKGNELLAYALIYGFTQDGETEFSGSLSYIAEWLCSTRRTAINVIQGLVEKGYIEKIPVEVNHVKFNRYKAVSDFTSSEKISLGVVKNFHQGSEKISPNNTIYNTKENTNYIYTPILDYLNEKLGTKYKTTSEKTRKLIDARVKEGFGVEDFKKVIDNKVQDWKGTDMEKYLRPETLFGTKFESYLNAVVSKPKPKNAFNDFSQREYDYNDLQRRLGV